MNTVKGERTKVSAWSISRSKRIFDLVIALLATLIVLPVMAIAAVSVWVFSGTPILFRQPRCGRNRKTFTLVKFRSMRQGEAGAGITAAGDNRITAIGAVLRKSRIDELPQLLHVLRGEMSLVGPRPDLPEYIADLNESGDALMQLRPGITGWATLHFIDEEKMLAGLTPEQVRQYYVQEILPRKAVLDLDYAARATMISDLKVLGSTCLGVFLAPTRRSGLMTPASKPVSFR